ncbi:MAG: M66 family metalloprotease [Burkholderiaceae bacterium]
MKMKHAFAMLAALGVSACGGGSDAPTNAPQTQSPPPGPGTAPAPPPAPAPAPAPGPRGYSIASVELGQALLFPSRDAGLVLVANRTVLAKFNVTSSIDPSIKPTGTVRVENAAGLLLQELPLDAPAGALPSSAPLRPSFADSYSVTIPAALVQPGMRLTPRLTPAAQNETTLAPRVGGGVTVRLVAIPIQIGSTLGQIVDRPDAYLTARMPVTGVTREDHAPFVSRAVTQLPTTAAQWNTAFSLILNEIDDLHLLENAASRTYYYGFVPKRTFGLAGIGYRPGNAAIGFDMPSQPLVVKETMAHEVGHNLSLAHAPCGGPAGVDPQYPYANALRGAGNRFIWGYDAEVRRFIDPTPTDAHDLMSYCSGDWLSDYNYRKIQGYLTPADRALSASDPQASLDVAQELVMVSGQINGGVPVLQPLKPLHGNPRWPDPSGPYLLRITTQQGSVIDYRFDVREIDHAPEQQRFGFTIPHPGAITKLEVLLGAQVLTAKELRKRALSATGAPPGVALQMNEQAGLLQVTWDAARYPYLAVTHLGAKRTVLALELEGGSTSLPLAALPPGGQFEFGLSDGLNSERIVRDR